MLILDTNHYSEFARQSVFARRLTERIADSHESAFLTIITAAEVLKGWLAAVRPRHQTDRGVHAYGELQESISDLSRWVVLPWTSDAADTFDALESRKLRIGTLDLRIALEYEATVLTRNLRDFSQVPGLKVENWLD